MTERPAKRRRVQDFIDYEATVAKDEEEEEYGEEEGDFIQNDEELSEEISGAQMNTILREHEQRRSEKKNFISDLEKRYVASDEGLEMDEEEEVDYGPTPTARRISSTAPSVPSRSVSSAYTTDKTSLIPTNADPSLFLLKCKHGKEKEIACILMQKYFDYLETPQPLLITGVLVLDNLAGHIYIEALKEAHVRKAIEGVENLSQGKFKMVPVVEMPQVMEVPKDNKGIPKPNDWVRMSRGVYKDDLARVIDVEEASGTVTVQIVPRLQFSGQSQKKGQRPPKRLFNKQEIIDNGGYVQEKRDLRSGIADYYEGEKYVDGFLHKKVSVKGIKTKNVDPKLEEMQLFGTDSIRISNMKASEFKEGDAVRIMVGELRGESGIILNINKVDKTVEILPDNHDLGDQAILADIKDIEYNIDIGSFVQVTSGPYQGETGDVVTLKDHKIVLHSREKNKEMEVFISDIKQVSHVTTNESYKEYSLHDLVKLSGQTCGVIIHVGNNFFKILDNQGIVKSYTYQELQGKMKNDQISKKDPKGNIISKDDEIKVISGNYTGVEGIVKHIFRNHLFCFSRDVMDNNGMFVTSPRNCEVKGGIVSNSKAPMPAPKNFSRHKISTKKQGKTVRITTGPYKGYIGTVKGAGANNILRIELHSQPKIVNVEEKSTDVIETPSQKSGHIPTRTPSYYGTETPFNRYGSHTPLHTAQTPMVTGYAPSTPGGWDKNIPNTPHAERVPESPFHSVPTPGGVFSGSNYRNYSTPGIPTTTPGVGGGFSRLPTTPGVPTINQQRPETPGLPDNRYSGMTPGVSSFGQQRPVTPGVGLGDSRSYGTTSSTITPGYNLGRQNPVTPGFTGPSQSYPPITPGYNVPTSRGEYPPTTPSIRPNIPQTPGMGNLGRPMYGQGRSMGVPQTPGFGPVPSTPGSSHPTTPGAPQTSHMPQQQYRDDVTPSWIIPGVEVRVDGRVAEIVEARGSNRIAVRFQDGHTTEVGSSHLSKTTPKLKDDKVVICEGSNHGKKGTISHISDPDGSKTMCVIQLDSGDSAIVAPLDYVAKLSHR